VRPTPPLKARFAKLELVKQKLDSLRDVLEVLDVERIAEHVREDREAR
jgi:hypothetical protein